LGDCRLAIRDFRSKVAAIARYQYLLLLAGCLAVTLPLEVFLGAGVYRRWQRTLRTLTVPVVIFAAWDAVAIRHGDWSFNPHFVTGWQLPLRVPVEEMLFFVVVPLCALLTYESVRQLLGRRRG
jgi:lycopene cyclase domain-containing protein